MNFFKTILTEYNEKTNISYDNLFNLKFKELQSYDPPNEYMGKAENYIN